MYQRWNEEEINFLKINYGLLTIYEIATHLNRTPNAVKERAKICGIKISEDIKDTIEYKQRFIRSKYSINKEYFAQPNINNCYWAGFIAGDGHLYSKHCRLDIGLNSRDKELLEKFVQDTNFSGPIIDRQKFDRRTNKYYANSRVRISCGIQSWYSDLNKYWNIKPCKSKSCTGPNTNILEHNLSFIIGIIDADGCIGISNNKLSFTILGTKKLLEWISDTLFLLESTEPYSERNIYRRNKENIYSLSYNSFRAYKLLLQLNKIQTPYKLQRKWSKINEFYHIRKNIENNSNWNQINNYLIDGIDIID